MKIKRSPLIFHNVISTKVECRKYDWVGYARELRNAIIKNGLYATGPVIYTVEDTDKDNNMCRFCLYIPINTEIEMEANDKYEFKKEMKFDDGLTLRHADLEDDIETETYDTLRAAAGNYKLKLKEPFYNIYLDVYGDGIIDVYAPIEGADGGRND
ncbi:MAG TPA: DUF5085 domain-containing protein [Clostridium sp.]|nr:DUF5085 domain-containing protein [Clostridium sp.]